MAAMVIPVRHPAMAPTEPTERSNPPLIMQNVIPTAMIMLIDICRLMLMILLIVMNRGSRMVKMMRTATSEIRRNNCCRLRRSKRLFLFSIVYPFYQTFIMRRKICSLSKSFRSKTPMNLPSWRTRMRSQTPTNSSSSEDTMTMAPPSFTNCPMIR